ncbi:MAG: hypothetical protein AAGC83_10865 [Pseudomonadota bacterium]
MKLQTFTADTTTEAMADIRREIGEDAIIVATREHPSGGIAVTVVVDELEEEVPAPDPLVFMPEQHEADIPAEISHAETAPRFSMTEPEANDVAEQLYATFRAHRLPAAIGGTLMDLAVEFETNQPVTALAAALKRTFAFDPIDFDSLTGPIMAVGPPGAGKTQSLGKLAARAVMAGKTVAMITTDTERTGRSATFAGFAGSLGAVLAEAPDTRTLNRAINDAIGADLVLIDTPGANHFKQSELDRLTDNLIDGLVEPILVAPAGIDPMEAADMADAYAGISVHRAIATRFDTVKRLGAVLAIGHEKHVRFAHFGIGQRIKDGLCDASPMALARAMLPEQPLPDSGSPFTLEERLAG